MRLPEAFASARRGGARLRDAVVAPGAQVASPDVLILFRYLVVIFVVVAALGATVWVRMAVRHTALQLDQTRSELARATIERDRMLVERALLREPGRLQGVADGLGLVAPVATLDVRGEPTP